MNEQNSLQWWAQGDTPVRTDSRVTYLVDGRNAMLMMCRYFLKARKYIYLANWGITPMMELVRGQDHRAGPDGSPQQTALLAELRAEGLTEDAIAFWQTYNLSLQAILGYAVSRGVEVKVLPWKTSKFFAHYNPEQAQSQLAAVGVTCMLDDSSEGILHHPVESLHQKISIIDGTHAFVGGIDLLIEQVGDFDRWDTPVHIYSTELRRTPEGNVPHPWHDAHALIEGPAAGDVELNFRQRWNDVVERHHYDQRRLVPEHPLPPPLPLQNNYPVQIARTIPEHTYNFKPLIIRGIAQLYANALKNIQRFIYLENQYFWLRTFSGIDLPFAGDDNPEMEQNIRELGAALQRGATMTLILPDHPNVGRAFSDAGIARLRAEAPQALEEGRLQVFCLATSSHEGDHERYRPVYVHAKVAIIDDLWTTVGSANLNNRGMRDDTEMNVATFNAELAHNLRLMLQGEHLGLLNEDDLFALSRLTGQQPQSQEERMRAIQIYQYLENTLGNPLVAVRLMHQRAWDNLNRYKTHQALSGHLLPYLTAEEAIQQGLVFHEEHGCVEAANQA